MSDFLQHLLLGAAVGTALILVNAGVLLIERLVGRQFVPGFGA